MSPMMPAPAWRLVLSCLSTLLCLILSIDVQAQVAGAGLSVRQVDTTLANGLKVIVREDRRAPTAVHMIWYRAGSMDEVNGRTGIAHLLEHMMFKGTNRYPAGEFSRRVAALGGRENAFTSRDYTAYYQQIPADALPEMMTLEADRMANLSLQADLFERERDVVKEERRLRVDDSAGGLMSEQLMALSYTASPYRTPVIGWMGDLAGLTVDDARHWYDTWYSPANAVLIVVGDLDAADVFREAERTYGRITPRELPARRVTPEPPQVGIRRAVVKAPAQAAQIVLAFHVPRLVNLDTDTDPFALEMLAAILDVGDTGRLTRELVRGTRLANGASASYSMLARGPVQFTLSGTPADGRSVEELEQALREQVARIARDGVTDDELDRIKTQYVASQVYGLDSMFGQVMRMGALEMVGLSHRDGDRLLERIRGVQAHQVQSVAARLFGDDALTVLTLDPQPVAGVGASAALSPAQGIMR